MADITTVLASGAFSSETPCALTAQVAIGRNGEGGRLEFVGLGAAFDVANSFEDCLDFNLKSG